MDTLYSTHFSSPKKETDEERIRRLKDQYFNSPEYRRSERSDDEETVEDEKKKETKEEPRKVPNPSDLLDELEFALRNEHIHNS